MFKVGITGGIGTGKTTVCRLFEKLDIPVYYADDRAKWLMQNEPELVAALQTTFGKAVYDGKGQLDRKYLGNLVFKDPQKLTTLNALVHPVVATDSMTWLEQQATTGHSYSLKEAALLFESGSYKLLDKIIVVAAPLDLRIARVMQRDKVTKAAVESRIRNQMPQEEKEALADFVIQNIELSSLEQQVFDLHQHFLTIEK